MKLFGFDVDESINQLLQNAEDLKEDLTWAPLPSGPEVWGEGKKNGDKMKEEIRKKNLPAPEEELGKMSWSDLLDLRRKTTDPEIQEALAPFEHRAYAREDVESNPEKAALYGMLIPGYQAAKAVGAIGARTQPSLEQMQQGFVGVYEGLRNRFLKDENKLLTEGLVQEGNIDINKRVRVDNQDNTFSTVESMSFTDEDGVEILIPTLSPVGKKMTEQESVDLYYKTGKHLGKFASPELATKYAKELSKRQGRVYNKEKK